MNLKKSVLTMLILASLNSYGANVTSPSKEYNWGKVKIGAGGYIPGIVTNSSQKGLMYARTDMGGAYRWDDTKKEWIQLMEFLGYDDWNSAGVEGLATDTIEPNRLYVFAGMYNNDWSDENAKLFISKDYGNSFDIVELPFKAGGNMPGRDIGERIVVDPNNNKVLYIGTRGDDKNGGKGNGLWKSDDYGKTWKKLNDFPDEGQEKDYFGNAYGIGWVIFDETSAKLGESTNRIFVGVQDKDGEKIYLSENAGKSWVPLKGQPLGREIKGKMEGMYAHKAVISKGIMYVTYKSEIGPYGGGFGNVYKYDINKKTWTDVTPVEKTLNRENGIPFGGITVDPKNPDVVMVVTQNLWWPDELIFRTVDGGKTWTGGDLWKSEGYDSAPVLTKRFTMDYSETPWLNWGDKNNKHPNVKIGWMLGDLELDPFDTEKIIWASGASVYEAQNISALDKKNGIVNIKLKVNGIEETAVLDLISPSTGAPLLSSVGDIGGFRHENIEKSSEMMITPTFGSSTDIDYAEQNPNFIVKVGNPLDKGGTRIAVSEDNGKTWKPGKNSWSGVDETEGGAIAVTADGKVIIWSPTNDKVVAFSKDKGKTWAEVQGLPKGVKLYSDRVNSQKVYAFKDGKFYVSTNSGESFLVTADKNLPSRMQSGFKSVPNREGDIWLVSGTDNGKEKNEVGVWHSVDSGKTFIKLNSIDEASCIGFGKSKEGMDYPAIYVNGKVDGVRGIYCSTDKGDSWVRINDDKHQYGNATAAISGDMHEFGKVYFGTNGFGIAVGTLKK